MWIKLLHVSFTKVLPLTILANKNFFQDVASIEASIEYIGVFRWEYKPSIGT